MHSEDVFMGKNGFYWFFGTVEDNGDPEGLGRCKVRIAGWHHESPEILPTSTLPWAYPITPITNAAVGGVGVSPIGPQPGTRVCGWFLDGITGQQPVMFGTVPGNSEYEYKRNIETGSTPWAPNLNKLIWGRTAGDENDSPRGDSLDNNDSNYQKPDNLQQLDVNRAEWVLPYTGFVSSGYKSRSRPNHKGVDICPAGYFEQTDAGRAGLSRLTGPTGLPCFSAADGEVVYIWKADKGQRNVSTNYDKTGTGSRSFGNAIAIRHKLSTGTFTTIYAHLGISQDAGKDPAGAGIYVNVGDKVSAGQQIGAVGRSHCYTSATHLHFEIRQGVGLPAQRNDIHPGRIFPQLHAEHTSQKSWMQSQTNYKIDKLPYDKDEAPVIAGEPPKE